MVGCLEKTTGYIPLCLVFILIGYGYFAYGYCLCINQITNGKEEAELELKSLRLIRSS